MSTVPEAVPDVTDVTWNVLVVTFETSYVPSRMVVPVATFKYTLSPFARPLSLTVTVTRVPVRLHVPDFVTVGSQMLTFRKLTLVGVTVMPFRRVR